MCDGNYDGGNSPLFVGEHWSLQYHANVMIIVQRAECRDSATDRYLSANLGVCMAVVNGDCSETGGAPRL